MSMRISYDSCGRVVYDRNGLGLALPTRPGPSGNAVVIPCPELPVMPIEVATIITNVMRDYGGCPGTGAVPVLASNPTVAPWLGQIGVTPDSLVHCICDGRMQSRFSSPRRSPSV